MNIILHPKVLVEENIIRYFVNAMLLDIKY